MNEKPNILLISIDTLRADHLSCYGYHRYTTPQIDYLADEGIKFTKAYSTAVWTSPAHSSMLTGLYTWQHGVIDNKKLNKEIPTISEILFNNGYRTVGIVNNPQVGAFVGFDKGHEKFYEIWEGITSRNLLVRGSHFLTRSIKRIMGTLDDGARKTNKVVKDWLNSHKDDERPFFMFLHYLEPHNPINAPHPFKKKFVNANSLENVDSQKLRELAQNPLNYFTDNLKLGRDEIQYLISLYDGEIAYVDSMVGEIIRYIRGMNLLDNTLVIITADHGEHFGEHDLFSHVSSLYEPIVHVPLIMRYPKYYPASMTSEHPVQHIDIFPTILELLDIKSMSLKHLPGKSLLPRNGKIEIDLTRPILAEWEGRIPEFVRNHLNTNDRLENYGFTRKTKMILQGDEKYIWSESGEELYNLRSDPNELSNLASSASEKCSKFRETLSQISSGQQWFTDNEERKINEVVKNRLKELGYL